MTKARILEIIVFLFVMLFMYAALSKVTEYREFEGQLGKSPLILAYAHWLAFMVPAIEIIISILLLVPRTQLIALYASYSLMFLFTAYIGFILAFSPYVPCSCGGILSTMGWTEHLIFNAAFTLLGLLGIHLNLKNTQPSPSVVMQ